MTRFFIGELGPLLLCLTLGLGRCAQGAVFIVSDTNDTLKVTSLRGAVIAANRVGGRNTIILGRERSDSEHPRRAWIYQLTIQGADEDGAQTGDLNIKGHLSIVGAASNVTIDATALEDRVFQVHSNASLTLSHLTITGGVAGASSFSPAATEGEPGGAILNWGTLIMEGCVVSGNLAGAGGNGTRSGNGGTGGNGGGICNFGTASLRRCSLAANSAGQGGAGNYGWCQGLCIIMIGAPVAPGGEGGSGGGIYNAGRMSLNFSTISSNCAGVGGSGDSWGDLPACGAGGGGGGVFNTGILTLDTCTISGNQGGSGGSGGGVYASTSNGGNGANGGGIYNAGPAAALELTSCSIVLNAAGFGGNGGFYYGGPEPRPLVDGGPGGCGGGIFNAALGTDTTLRNTLIALNASGQGGLPGPIVINYGYPTWVITNTVGNPGPPGVGPDLAGNFLSEGFNLVGMADGSSEGLTNRLRADQIGTTINPVDPLIGPLQINGGPTPTHALLPGSPAINQGDCFGVHTDQRGRSRPFDYPGLRNATDGDGSDIGAFELHAP